MALHLVILIFMILIIVGLLALGKITDLRILYPLAFVFLMFSGLFVTISEGIILNDRVASIDADTLTYEYEDVVLGLDNPVVLTYSQVAFYLGLVLTIFSGFAWFLNPLYNESPFSI